MIDASKTQLQRVEFGLVAGLKDTAIAVWTHLSRDLYCDALEVIFKFDRSAPLPAGLNASLINDIANEDLEFANWVVRRREDCVFVSVAGDKSGQ